LAEEEKMFRRPGKWFDCFCGEIIGYEDEAVLKAHINSCERYHRESPFYKFFSSLDLKVLPEVHLVAIRNEFSNYTDQITMEL